MQAIPSTVPRPGVRPVPVVIYSRVSTSNQVGGRFDSCASQEKLARQHIARNVHKSYCLKGVFRDQTYSGTSNRPRSARIPAVKRTRSGPKPSGSPSEKIGGDQ